MKSWIKSILVVAALCCPSPAQENEDATIEPHRTGAFQVTLEGLEVAILRQTTFDYKNKKLQGAPNSGYVQEQNGVEAVYEVHVPANYDQEEAFGLVVWISASDSGRWPPPWEDLLARHKLIAIGANQSGNKRPSQFRAGYALQAVKLMLPNYNIDFDRIYLSGISGGGRACSTSMMLYNQVFSGGFPTIGANPIIPMANVDSRGNRYRARGLQWINPDRLDDASSFGRYVFLTGEKDFNQKNVKAVSTGYKRNKFKFIEYMEQPQMGHGLQSAEYIEKAVMWLDEKLPEVAAAKFKEAKKRREDAPGQCFAFYETASRHCVDQEQVETAEVELEKLKATYGSELTELKKALESLPKDAARKVDEFAVRWGRLAVDDLPEVKEMTAK